MGKLYSAFVLTILSIGVLCLFLNDEARAGTDKPTASAIVVRNTLTYTVYLPSVFNRPLCTNPPSGSVVITGRATLNGQPVGAGIEFGLYYGHFEYPPSHILTMTTDADGSFCSGLIGVMPYCRGIWYQVYQPDFGWQQQVFACESGKVYTVTAELSQS